MTQTRDVAVELCTVVRTPVDGGAGQGCGGSTHLYVGRHHEPNDKEFDYSCYIKPKIGQAWNGVGQIKSFMVEVYTDDGIDGDTGLFVLPDDNDHPKVSVRRLSSSFRVGDNSDGQFNASDFTSATSIASTEITKGMRKDAGGLTQIDLTAYANAWAPSTVKQSDGKKGAAAAHYGIVLMPASTLKSEAWSGWSDKYKQDSFRVHFTLVYEPGLTTPDTPVNLSPSGSVTSVDAFEGDFSDPLRTGAYQKATQVEVYPRTATQNGQDVTGSPLQTYSETASATERADHRFHVLRGSLQLQSNRDYKWRARVQNDQGQWSDWTNLITFSEQNRVPVTPTLTPNGGAYATLAGLLFRGGVFSDPDGDALLAYQIQWSHLADDDPLWDSDPTMLIWDTGKRLVAHGATGWETGYGGPSLTAGDYTWRARQWDAREAISDWAYASISLTQDMSTEGGTESVPQIQTQAPWRIVIYGMGTHRGPGGIVAILSDAKNPGASLMYNSPGEIHFTLVKDHPQISVIEPRQTHYAVQFHTADGWKDIFNGLITDFDATDTDVVFYGIDYLGLFDSVVDDRFDAANPQKPYTNGGSKYVDVSLLTIFNDQVTRAIGLDNSPVGFIHKGSFDAMDEHATLYTTMQSALQVMSGLVDSHKQGTGKRTRFKVFRDASDGIWKVRLEEDAGITRDNLRLDYGELVNGYRVIPFGTNWSSRLNVVGRDRDNARIFYKSATSPGIDPAVWGRWDAITVLDNIADENDLERRVKQLAVHQAKLGKQLGIAIRNGLLMPRSGYDVCDAIPVAIKDGAVDTARFGSGYWIINGIAWEGADDGSSTVILTLLPREDSTAPSSDLIPSAPISTQAEWQVGWVPPDVLGDVSSRFYVDQSTGIVYERDESGDETVYVPQSHFSPDPPSTPTGLLITTSVVTDSNGLTKTMAQITIDPTIDASVRTTYVSLTSEFE